MRHGIGYRKLNKTGEHRKALFKNMLNSLIKYEQIITTLPKAKELKRIGDKVLIYWSAVSVLISVFYISGDQIREALGFVPTESRGDRHDPCIGRGWRGETIDC